MCANLRSLTCAHTGNPEAFVWVISEDDVVYQLGFAHANGADGRIAVAHVVDTLKGVGVNHREITGSQSYNPLQHAPANRLERARAALAPDESIVHRKACLGRSEE